MFNAFFNRMAKEFFDKMGYELDEFEQKPYGIAKSALLCDVYITEKTIEDLKQGTNPIMDLFIDDSYDKHVRLTLHLLKEDDSAPSSHCKEAQ
jgi:hypothetical protein